MCMACEQTMTVGEVLALTMNSLRGVYIPVELSETIGIPVSNAIKNIKVCLDALENAAHEKATAEPENAETNEEGGNDGDADAE